MNLKEKYLNIEIIKTAIDLLKTYNNIVNNPQAELVKRIDMMFNAKMESGIELLNNALLIKDKSIQKDMIIHAVSKLHEVNSIYKSLIKKKEKKWFRFENTFKSTFKKHSLLSSHIYLNLSIAKCNQFLLINDNRKNEIQLSINEYVNSFFQDEFLKEYNYLNYFIELNYILPQDSDEYEYFYNVNFKIRMIDFIQKYANSKQLLYVKKRFLYYDNLSLYQPEHKKIDNYYRKYMIQSYNILPE